MTIEEEELELLKRKNVEIDLSKIKNKEELEQKIRKELEKFKCSSE